MPDQPGPGDSAEGQGGNRARDHLANERTFLAWLRTSLGILALAVAVAHFGPSDGPSDTVSVIGLALLGGLVLAIGTYRYYRVSIDLERDRFELTRRGPLVLAGVIVVGAVVVLPLLMRH